MNYFVCFAHKSAHSLPGMLGEGYRGSIVSWFQFDKFIERLKGLSWHLLKAYALRYKIQKKYLFCTLSIYLRFWYMIVLDISWWDANNIKCQKQTTKICKTFKWIICVYKHFKDRPMNKPALGIGWKVDTEGLLLHGYNQTWYLSNFLHFMILVFFVSLYFWINLNISYEYFRRTGLIKNWIRT